MSQMLTYFETQQAKAKEAAKAIMDAAEQEARPLSPDETATIQGHLKEVDDYRQKAADQRDKDEMKRRIEGDVDDVMDGTITTKNVGLVRRSDPAPLTIGEAFVQSGAYRAIIERKQRNGGTLGKFKSEPVFFPHLNADGSKAASSPLLESAATDIFSNGTTLGAFSTLLREVQAPGFLHMAPRIADLLTTIPITSGNAATYPVVEDKSEAALSDMPIAENANKKVVAYEFGMVVEKLVKLAVYTKLSEEYLEDAPTIVAFINADLPAQIKQVEDAYLADELYDSVSDASSLSGASTKADEILAAVTEIQAAGLNPNGMLISPTNWAEVLVEKFAGGTADYVGGGPFGSTGNPWGLTVVVTPFATDDHPLIGDFTRGAKVYRRGGVSVDATNSDGTDFIKNIVTIRAEERLVLGKTYPEAFVTADLS